MSAQLALLLRVKKLKEEQAFRRLMTKRRELGEAESAAAAAQRRADDSAATLSAREDAVYRVLIGQDVEMNDVEIAKGRALRIEQDHGRLVDDSERAAHVRMRIEEELAAALKQHRDASRVKDKYEILLDDISRMALEQTSAREESEIEDIFGARRTKTA